RAQLGERLWLAPSCSLLHVPVDLAHEQKLDAELKGWLSFARQKLDELHLLAQALDAPAEAADALAAQRAVIAARATSPRIHNPAVQQQMAALDSVSRDRQSPFDSRISAQQQALKLPAFPTTTIGSFPQTREIRALRRDLKKGALSE